MRLSHWGRVHGHQGQEECRTQELVLADISSEYPVIMLPTNLGSVWRYFWFQKGIIASCQLDLPQGIALLNSLANVRLRLLAPPLPGPIQIPICN